MRMELIHGQPSWRFACDQVEAAVTETGGHLAPVRFFTSSGPVEPFAIAPWVGESGLDIPPILEALRGDFFCAPFGGNARAYRGEIHPPHGETANAKWAFEALEKTPSGVTLRLALTAKARPGRVEKQVTLRNGHTAVYCRHRLLGMSGRMSLGHHPILKFPDRPGCGAISTSQVFYGQVYPGSFENPARGGYSFLKPGAVFKRIDRVPALDGTRVDLSLYPARRGFEDLVMLVHEDRPDFAWTAVTFPGERYVWFSLKDPRVLRSSVFWFSNGGRHYTPWNGRHVNVMGLEDVTAYFDFGLAESARPNPLSRAGFRTSLELKPKVPLTVNYIMAVAAIPAGFDRVRRITPQHDFVELTSASGKRVQVPLDPQFLYSE